MEDDEETRTQTQTETRSGEQQLALIPHGGVTVVTVAAAPPPPPPSAPLTLALPIQQSPARPTLITGAVGGGGGGREDCWSERATSILIDAWGERYMELSRGNLKQAHWKEVADIVNNSDDHGRTPKTDIQCKNRIDTVKKKFKVEKSRVLAGFGPSRWPFFERMDRLIGPTGLNSAGKGLPGVGVGVSVSPVSTGFNSQESVPVGIPFGVRQAVTLPFAPQLMPPPHFQSQLQHQQHIRHNFPTPISQQPPRFMNINNHNHNSVSNAMLQQQQQHFLQQQQQQQQQYRRGVGATPIPTPPPPPVETDSEKEGWSEGSGDSLPPETGYERRNVGGSGGVRKGKGKGKKAVKVWGNSVRELTRAILKFGEAYETAESAKLQHIVEMEKERMKFAKELELQRMKFFMKTQLELSQFNDGSGSGSGNGNGNSDSRGGGSR